MKLTTSPYFKSMVKVLYYEELMFKGSKPFAIFLWLVFPVLPFVVLGWYIAEVLDI